MSVQIKINGRSLEAEDGMTVLQAALLHGIEIPTLCYHRNLKPAGSCRLCLVELEPKANLATACTLQVQEGIAVWTETPRLAEMRKSILELLLSDYADAGYAAGDRDATEFERWLAKYGVRRNAGHSALLRFPVNADPNPVLWVDMNKCILCTRCIRACAEIQGRFVWGIGERGHRARVIAGSDTGLLEAGCESCGTCVEHCPTGALDDRMSVGLGRPDKVVTTTCSYCGVGCQLDLNIRNGRIIRVTGSHSGHNGRQLCVKGRYGYDYVHHSDRLKRPQVRRYLLEGRPCPAGGRDELVPVDWDTALDIVADSFTRIVAESGPDSIAVLASAKCTNEENYLMQKLARQVIGTNNVDHCARLCHASTVSGLAACYGSGAMSNTMEDIAHDAQALFVIGSNTTEQHPVFGTRLRQAVLQRGVPLVVADPRRIDIAQLAAVHLRQRPGTDVALLNGIMRIVLANGWQHQQFIEEKCEGFEEFRTSLEEYTPERVSETTGVPVGDLLRAAAILARNHPMAVIWSMGITQHTTGVLNVLALGNLQMLLGNMGVPGGGVNPLRGQNNVQGACDTGALPNLLPGYRPVTDANVRAEFESAWQLEPAGWTPDRHPATFKLSGNSGLTVTEMVGAAGAGKVRALYIVGENPAMTDPDLNHARQCLASCEFVVLQEIFPSETSAMADVVLPGVSWAEKDGTFTNTERRIQLIRQAVDPVGEARPDWVIIAELAERVLARSSRIPVGRHAGWKYPSPRAIMEEIASLTPAYSGIRHERLERGDQLHWPIPETDHPGTPILHVGHFTRGRGKFHVTGHLPPQEIPDEEYPFILTTGRVLYHWHGAEMTRRSQPLNELYPESVVEISPEDASKIGLNGKTVVRVRSRRGEMISQALITDRVCPGLVFANFHFPGAQNANNLTIAALDPLAKIPEYKVCAVRVEQL